MNNQFSLSHLYAFRSGGIPETEVGVFRGIGSQGFVASSSSYFTTLADTVQGYREVDFEAAPNANFMDYKIQNIGYDDTTGKWQWGAFVANEFVNPRYVWETAEVNWAQAESGGEVTRASGIQMQVRMISPHRILNPGDALWHDWNDAYMAQVGDATAICNDAGFYLSYNARFDDYQVTGIGP